MLVEFLGKAFASAHRVDVQIQTGLLQYAYRKFQVGGIVFGDKYPQRLRGNRRVFFAHGGHELTNSYEL
jgi:hypothetical protein